MSLTNEQYDKLMHVYDERQAARRQEIAHRKKTAYEKLPCLADFDARISSLAVEEVRRRIMSDDPKGEQASPVEEMRRLEREKLSALKSADLPGDYLNVPYVCPDCRDTGYTGAGRPCHCFEQLAIDLLYEKEDIIREAPGFDDFDLGYYSDEFIDTKTGRSAKDYAKAALFASEKFVSEFDNTFANILLYGNPGTGKTHLSNTIARALVEGGRSVVYQTAFELFSVMKREAFSRDRVPHTDYMRIFSCDLLIIDDLGTEFSNSMTTSQLFELLNERLLQKRSTLISTNLTLEGLSDFYTERLFSRLMEHYTLLPLIGEDIRIARRTQCLETTTH